MIPAKDCQNMAEIRAEIDDLDQKIIQLMGQRFEYVKAASKFKTSEMAVKAPERFKAMMITRREWAIENGLSPDIIEKIYTDLVQYFIGEELKHWKK
jgi:isochorismate pyruvate lyase